MANQIIIDLMIRHQIEGQKATLIAQDSGLRLSQTGNDIAGTLAVVPITWALIPLGNVDPANMWTFKNLHATNTVEIGYDVGGTDPEAVIEIKPGHPQIIDLKSDKTWYWKASGANTSMRYAIFEP